MSIHIMIIIEVGTTPTVEAYLFFVKRSAELSHANEVLQDQLEEAAAANQVSDLHMGADLSSG